MNVTILTVLMADAHYMLCTYTNNSYYSITGVHYCTFKYAELGLL